MTVDETGYDFSPYLQLPAKKRELLLHVREQMGKIRNNIADEEALAAEGVTSKTPAIPSSKNIPKLPFKDLPKFQPPTQDVSGEKKVTLLKVLGPDNVPQMKMYPFEEGMYLTKQYPQQYEPLAIPKHLEESPVFTYEGCLLYTSPSPRDGATSRMPSSA